MTRIGVLALQGNFEAHARALRGLDATVLEVRRTAGLSGLDGLVMPGGETTTLLRLMTGEPLTGDEPWFDALRRFHASGGALFATCAGAILLARRVLDPAQECLGLLAVTIRRNAYGRQIDSFEQEIRVEGFDTALPAVFIRAPRFVDVGPEVEVLARLDGEPVLVRQGRILAGTFHPELTEDRRLHRMFHDLVSGNVTGTATRSEADETESLVAH